MWTVEHCDREKIKSIGIKVLLFMEVSPILFSVILWPSEKKNIKQLTSFRGLSKCQQRQDICGGPSLAVGRRARDY